MKVYLCIAISFLVLIPATQSLGDDHTVAEIKTAWEQTAEKTESCRFNWTEVRHYGDQGSGGGGLGAGLSQGANTTAAYTHSLLLKNSDHFRLERISTQFDNERDRNITKSYVSTYDGREARKFYGQDFVDDDLYPRGYVSHKHSDWDNYHVLPVLFAVRPLNNQFSPFNDHEYTIADQTVEVDGRQLLELRPASEKADEPLAKYVYFVDPERNFAIERVIKEWKDEKLWQIDLSNRLDEASGCWVPDGWELHAKQNDMRCLVRNVQVDLAAEFADDQFLFQFPDGTLITDSSGLSFIEGNGE